MKKDICILKLNAFFMRFFHFNLIFELHILYIVFYKFSPSHLSLNLKVKNNLKNPEICVLLRLKLEKPSFRKKL